MGGGVHPIAYDADEINLKADAVFAHIYTAGFGGGAQVLH
jgi:type I restriction enzyme R subunit